MLVHLNGEPREIENTATVAALISQLGLKPAACAVEVNQRLVRRADHADRRLADGDRIEIVTLVGGG